MTSISWWRSWHGAPMDPKWQLIAARAKVKTIVVTSVAWALMDYASQNDPRGSIEGFDIEVYAFYSGIESEEVTAVIRAMTDKNIIVDNQFKNWEKRQPKREDDSTPRVRRYRESLHEEDDCNAMERDVTQCNAPDKDKDKETDKETEAEAAATAASRPEIFRIYEREIGALTPMIADALIEAEKIYPHDWFMPAFREAADHNARSWKYVETVLKRWQVEGFGSNNKQRPNGKSPPGKRPRNEELRKMAGLEE